MTSIQCFQVMYSLHPGKKLFQWPLIALIKHSINKQEMVFQGDEVEQFLRYYKICH